MAKEIMDYYSRVRTGEECKKIGSGPRIMIMITALEHIRDKVSNETAKRAVDNCRVEIGELAKKMGKESVGREQMRKKIDTLEKRVRSFSHTIDIEMRSREEFEKRKIEQQELF